MNPKENFKKAIEEDEYAEFELGDGYVLITDHEFDGTFNPYIHPPEDDDGENIQKVDDMLCEADIFEVTGMEWDDANEVYRPYGFIPRS